MKRNRKKATKLKILITDEDKKISIPSIPFWLINLLIALGFGITSIAFKYGKDIDENTKKILKSIDRKDIKEIIKELKKCGPTDLVKVEEGNETIVKISIL